MGSFAKIKSSLISLALATCLVVMPFGSTGLIGAYANESDSATPSTSEIAASSSVSGASSSSSTSDVAALAASEKTVLPVQENAAQTQGTAAPAKGAATLANGSAASSQTANKLSVTCDSKAFDEADADILDSLLVEECDVLGCYVRNDSKVDSLDDMRVSVEGASADELAYLVVVELVIDEKTGLPEIGEELDSVIDPKTNEIVFDAENLEGFAVVNLAGGESNLGGGTPKLDEVTPLADGDVRPFKGVDSRAEVGLQINLFDYYGTNPDLDGGFDINSSYQPGMTGINVANRQLRPFRFFTGGTKPSSEVDKDHPPADDTCNINNYTGGAAVANQGIVQNTLDNNGYPVLNAAADGLLNAAAGESSLAYLFDGSDVEGKTAYRGLTGLFQRNNDNGYYYYDSNRNYAYYGSGQPNSEFKLYKRTFDKKDSTNYKIGYFPFDEYAKTDDQVGPTHKNHQFGMTISGDFVYPPNGTITRNNETKNMVFEFSGDDDVWVFVDGVLVLDIGGIHQPTGGKIDFATGEVTVDGATKCSDAGTTIGVSNNLSAIFQAAGETWDNSSYSTHHMDFFYLERGGYDSNCSISMNLVLTKTFDLDVEKEWSDGAAAHTSDSVAVQLYCIDAAGTKTAYGSPVTLNSANNWKTTFSKLPETDDSGNPYTFVVEEGTIVDDAFVASEQLTSTNGYSYKLTSTTYTNNNADVTSGFQVADKKNPTNGSIKLTNTKQIPPTQLTIFKEDATTKAPLSNVEFELWADANNSGALDDGDALAVAYSDAACTTQIAGAIATGSDGKANFYGLRPGVYWIKEVKTQSGYQMLKNPIRFEVNEDASKAYFYDSKTEVAITDHAVSVTVNNTKIQELPATGGTDKGVLCFFGSLLTVISAFAIRKKFAVQ